ncbi:hypothetical protein D3C81_1607340 [compost metagenome]
MADAEGYFDRLRRPFERSGSFRSSDTTYRFQVRISPAAASCIASSYEFTPSAYTLCRFRYSAGLIPEASVNTRLK